MSWLGCVLVVTDTQGQLYLYRLLPISEPGTTFVASFLGFQMYFHGIMYYHDYILGIRVATS